ncbi:MAG: dienelactone hydrolase family protein [Alphaproteobacteria bacterium]|jgi:dienelactone hydrolase|nr:dienelactone hydrolase family protein [Alphaproteobacteria bacterium]
MALKTILLASLGLLLGACVTASAGDPEDLARVWQRTFVKLPNDMVALGPAAAELEPAQKFPAVVYLHDCNGLRRAVTNHSEFLRSAGFAVFIPPSFARRERPGPCGPGSTMNDWGVAAIRDVFRMRLAETRHVIARLDELPWVDRSKVFIVGHSEGAGAAIRYQGIDVAGVVAIATYCWGGLHVPGNVPLLTMASTSDPWFQSPGQSCLGMTRGGPAETLTLMFDSSSHGMIGAGLIPDAEKALLEFLKRHSAS